MQVRSFLGAANVYRRVVQKYSDIVRPLNSILRKDAEPDWESATDEQTMAFETLKARLISPPIPALPKTGRPYMIDTDASAYQLGVTLPQQQDEEKTNEWVPIRNWSKTLTDTERNYSTTERECYSFVWSVTKLPPYIKGLTSTVRTDHDALRWLMTTGKLESPALGPFRVLKTNERTVVIERNQDVERINADRITYAPPPENAPPPEGFALTTDDINKNTRGPTYVVERLLEHSVKSDGTLEFLAKWYGYMEETWEPRRKIPEELVSQYFAQRRFTPKET